MVLSLQDAFLYRKKIASTYSFFDRGLIISSPLDPLYRVTSIMSQRSIFNHASGNIFYEAIRGFVETFKSKGLSDIMSSWVSTGQNLPISGNQIQEVLGNGLIEQFAKKLGSSGEEVSGGLASLLPEIIDKLTPNGSLPESDALLQQLSSLKKNLLNI